MRASLGTPGQRSSTRRGRIRSILIVDKDGPWAQAVRLELSRRGYWVQATTDPEAGRWRLHQRTYDLVVLSTTIGAWELEHLTRALYEQAQVPRLLLITTPPVEGASEAWRFLHPNRVVCRPCRMHDLVEAAVGLAGPAWQDIGIA